MKNTPPIKQKNSDLRPREFLTESEVEKLYSAAKKMGTFGYRNYCMLLITFKHGLRSSELLSLKKSQINLTENVIHLKRVKNSISNSHPLSEPEIRALKKIMAQHHSDHVFISRNNTPISGRQWRETTKKIGLLANLKIDVHTHMLRHSTGYTLANKGTDTRTLQHFLGHKNIQNTVIYTEMSAERFKDIW